MSPLLSTFGGLHVDAISLSTGVARLVMKRYGGVSEGREGSAHLVESAFKAYGETLHRYLMRRLADSQRAEDLAQETYLRLVRLKHKELVRAPQAYLFKIASNLVFEFRQREHREVASFDSRLADNSAERE